MARKKNESSIRGLGAKDKLTVQKSMPLLSLWRSELTLPEFKILDTYLARINSHDPEKRIVVFEKGELEKILGVQKINSDELKKRLMHLMGQVVEIPDEDEDTGFRLVTLFEEAYVRQDKKSGISEVKMECTPQAMKYIFNIENLGYLRYKLRCITSITSRYTYVMFIYLEKNRFRKTWEVDVDELKEILSCEKEETYQQFYRFNDLVLKRIQYELHEKTECRYSYEPVKKGRSVVAVRFTVETIPKVTMDDKQITVEQWEKTLEDEGRKERFWYVYEQLEPLGFNREQCEEVISYIVTVPDGKLPHSPVGAGGDDPEFRRYHYLSQKIAELNRRNKEKPIKNKYLYLLKMIKQDVGRE